MEWVDGSLRFYIIINDDVIFFNNNFRKIKFDIFNIFI